jgi:predicted nucleotidyltransferase component of viral defense system
MDKEITEFIADKMKIVQREYIEKDLILSKLLYYLSKEKIFFDNYAFKGGTCLIKCYLGYYRFSEDMDFTYVRQDEFKEKSQKKIREIISSKIDSLAEMLERIAKPLGLIFKAEKENKKYFQYGGGNAFVTFKLWYFSDELNKDTFVKIQINHREKLDFEVKELDAKPIIAKNLEKDLSVNFPDQYQILISPIRIKVYDLKEILVEKIRAILTRRGLKARDFIDIYKITKVENVSLSSLSSKIIDKTEASLRFEKYKLNLNDKQATGFKFSLGEEERMLLISLGKDFDKFLVEFKEFLQELANKFKVKKKD